MSHAAQRDIACPRCGHRQPFTIWESINGANDPALREKVISGEVFDYHCQQCGQVSRVGYPLLYHDPDHHMMIFMAQKDHREAAQGALEALLKMPFSPLTQGGYTVRAVTQPPELAEKILIMEHDLDDRVVEMNKLFIHANYMKDHPDAEIAHILLLFADQPRFLIMADKEPLPLSSPFEQATYDDIRQKYAAFFPRGMKENLFIDLEWAAGMMKPAGRLM
ncbi:MAG: CpXC domain-containing protein [Clostridia bacterium]|nr:CpXC domain-containing protein [Clostridia bacterium]